MIPVTKPHLPDKAKLYSYIDEIYQTERLTNNGPLHDKLKARLESYLGVENLLLVANGTLALQIAFKALNIKSDLRVKSEVITSPFSFVATASSMVWEGLKPVFCDVDKQTWCLDSQLIESHITEHTKAIVPVNIYGNACNHEEIQKVASNNGLKVIYDASHAFGVKFEGKSILAKGDAATLSFHATKIFHTIEGGAIIFKNKSDYELARKLINFGITGPDSIECLGINAKMSEFHAAMGLCVLDEMAENLAKRTKIWEFYESELKHHVQLQKKPASLDYNFSYFPVLLDSEKKVLTLLKKLKHENIFARRYFYPSLDSLPFLSEHQTCRISKDLSERILCLPIYPSMAEHEYKYVAKVVKAVS